MTTVNTGGSAAPAGRAGHRLSRDLGDLAPPTVRQRLAALLRRRPPPSGTGYDLRGRVAGWASWGARLSGVVYRPDLGRLAPEQLLRLRGLLTQNADVRELTRYFGGEALDCGLLSTKLVTNLGVAFIVDALHASATIANLKYHGYGTGTTAEAQTDAALVTELTTQYATDNTRPTGSQTEGATANIYRTVGTLSPDADVAITEHGIFDQASNAGGTLLDRSKFAAINLVAANGDSLQTTYDLTLTAGG